MLPILVPAHRQAKSLSGEIMADHPDRRVLSYRWLIYWVMAFVYLSAFFHRMSPAVVALDIQKTLGISAGMIGLLSSVYFYSYAVMQPPAGLLSDSLGPRKSVTIFLIVGAFGSILFGSAESSVAAIVGRTMVGLGAAMAWTPTMKILSKWFRPSEFATLTGLLLAVGGMGSLTAAAPLAWLSELWGWQRTFQVIGLGTLLLAVLVWLVVRDRPEDLGWPAIVKPNPETAREIGLKEGVREVLMDKYFWPLAIWCFFIMGSYFLFAGLWAGPYLIHVYGMTAVQAGYVLNMLAVGLVVGSLFWSFVSDRVLHSRKRVLIIASGLYVALAAFLCVFPNGLPWASLYVIFFLLGACSLAPGAVTITTTKELFPIEIAGTSIGTVNLFPFVGCAIMQGGSGWLIDRFAKTPSGAYPMEAYSELLVLILAAAAIGFLSTFVLKETFPHGPIRE
jgi:sugar phosphate permease